MKNIYNAFKFKFAIAAVAMIFILLFASCAVMRDTKVYYIDELEMFISIEHRDLCSDGTMLFRINLSKSRNFENNDFVEITTIVNDMGSIGLIFPTNDNRYIYISDQQGDVKRIESDEYKFKMFSKDSIYDEKIMSSRKWKSDKEYMDTTEYMDSIPGIRIDVGQYINYLDKWIDGEYRGQVPVLETRERYSKQKIKFRLYNPLR